MARAVRVADAVRVTAQPSHATTPGPADPRLGHRSETKDRAADLDPEGEATEEQQERHAAAAAVLAVVTIAVVMAELRAWPEVVGNGHVHAHQKRAGGGRVILVVAALLRLVVVSSGRSPPLGLRRGTVSGSGVGFGGSRAAVVVLGRVGPVLVRLGIGGSGR